MKKQTNNNNENLTATIKAVMKDNYSENDIQDFSCWIDNVLKNEETNYLKNEKVEVKF